MCPPASAVGSSPTVLIVAHSLALERVAAQVAGALAHPVLRHGPQRLGQAAALVGGAALPLALTRAIGPGRTLLGGVLVCVVVGAVLFARLHGRVEAWRAALVALAAFALASLVG